MKQQRKFIIKRKCRSFLKKNGRRESTKTKYMSNNDKCKQTKLNE